MALPFDWVDAFSDSPFGGNGCAVVHDGGSLDAARCMAFTRETGLVECTFVGPSSVADVRVRYFLGRAEIPFAGHPTVATAASLAARGLVEGGRVTFETGAGVVPVEVDNGLFIMTQVAPAFGAEVPSVEVAAIFGLAENDIVAPPQIVSTGLPFCITLLRDRATVERARLDSAALARFRAAHGGPDGGIMEPYLVCLEGATPAGRTFARLLLDAPSPPEDPFTGSATGATAAYLWSRGLIERPDYLAEQGHGMGRPGQARVEVLGPRDAITGVRVAGRAHVLMRGEVLLPRDGRA